MLSCFSEISDASDTSKDTEFTVPWILNIVPFHHYNDTITCPKTVGDKNNTYYCFNTDFQFECCDIEDYVISRFVI